MPHFTQQLNRNKEYYTKKYDAIIVLDLGNIHYKRAIIARNRRMVEHSDSILYYVVRSGRGAYQMLQYARKIDKTISIETLMVQVSFMHI